MKYTRTHHIKVSKYHRVYKVQKYKTTQKLNNYNITLHKHQYVQHRLTETSLFC